MWIFFCVICWVGATSVLTQDADVLILGGGMAGATAARTLVELGIDNFLIIEATDRIGGRIKETTIGGTLVELGAGWVVGGEGNPIYDMVVENNITTITNDFDDWQVVDERGEDVTTQGNIAYARMIRAFNFAIDHREKLLNSSSRSDFSVTNTMAQTGWIPQNAIDEAVEYFEIDFEAAVPGDISSLEYFYGTNYDFPYAEEELFVMEQNGGYVSIVKGILEQGVPDWGSKTLFNTVVEDIVYSDDGVTVTTNNGDFSGRFAVITFSLGVLQNQVINFEPALPEWKQEAIFGFNMGMYYHLYLKFPQEGDWFVPNNTEWTVLASETRGYFSIWQNLEKHLPGSRIMHGTITHEEVRRLVRLTDAEIQAEAMQVLRTIFGSGIPEPEEIAMSRWANDPYTYGSYPDWPVGYNLETFTALQASVGPLYFAGDAYHNDFGYVNGAYQASIRETTKLVQCFNDESNCIIYQPPPDYSN